MDGFAVWLEREPVCLPNRLRCEKPVFTIIRYSGLIIYRRVAAVLPGCSLLVGTLRAMAGRGRWPATTISGSPACESLGGVASVKSSNCGVD